MKQMYLAVISFTLFGLLAGCISDPKHVEEDFGNSVRQMVAAQIYDPDTASNPDAEPPLIVDGVIIGYGIDAYYDKAKKKEKDEPGFTFILN